MTQSEITERSPLPHQPRTKLSHTERLKAALSDLSPPAVFRYRSDVLKRYPAARFATDGKFGRIVAGDVLVSLPVPMIDPDAESLAWCDASERLGDGNQWTMRMEPAGELSVVGSRLSVKNPAT